jgi:hypothetical protein
VQKNKINQSKIKKIDTEREEEQEERTKVR